MKNMTRFLGLIALFLSSAPLVASAQGFAPAPGSLWAKVGYIYSQGQEIFAGPDELRFLREANPRGTELGDRVPFRSRQGQVVGGELYEHQATLDVVWSPLDRLVFGLSTPLQKMVHYSNTTNNYTTENTGFGDINLRAGYQLTPRSMDRLGVSLYTGVKIPTSTLFPYTNQALLTEGQVDASGTLASSLKLTQGLYLNGSAELRFRTEWADSDQTKFANPGNEVHTALGLGFGPTDWLWLSAGWSGFWGNMWRIQDPDVAGVPMVKRSYHAAIVGAYIGFGSWIGVPGLALDLFGKAPFAGRDHAVIWSGGSGLAYQF